jgi:hypothetical protein
MDRNRIRQLMIAFWVFIVAMLLWQFFSYNASLTQEAITHPVQKQYFFFHTNAPAATPSMAHSDKADIVQTNYTVQPGTPSSSSFTCLVTLKNVGSKPATSIQICVRPYRGVSNYDEDVGHQRNPGTLADDDPISLFNDWLSFPDLAPGESATRSVIFTNRTDIKPGANPKPQILFETVKAPAKPAAAPSAATPPATPQPPHHSGME